MVLRLPRERDKDSGDAELSVAPLDFLAHSAQVRVKEADRAVMDAFNQANHALHCKRQKTVGFELDRGG